MKAIGQPVGSTIVEDSHRREDRAVPQQARIFQHQIVTKRQAACSSPERTTDMVAQVSCSPASQCWLRAWDRAKAEKRIPFRNADGAWSCKSYAIAITGPGWSDITCTCAADRNGRICKHVAVTAIRELHALARRRANRRTRTALLRDNYGPGDSEIEAQYIAQDGRSPQGCASRSCILGVERSGPHLRGSCLLGRRGTAMRTQSPLTERGPQVLAGQVDALAQLAEGDHESYKMLATAREQLRALFWVRFKQRHEHSDKLSRLCRRHSARPHGTVGANGRAGLAQAPAHAYAYVAHDFPGHAAGATTTGATP
jgi:hypothetical protein